MERTTEQSVFSILFGNNYNSNDISEYEIKDPELLKAQARADILGKEAEMSINTETKSSKNSGFSNGLKRDTLNKMRSTTKGKTIETQIRESQNEGHERM